MPTNTYVALDKVTVGTATAAVNFTSIPQTYTDLVLITNAKYTSSTSHILVQLNGDTGTNYSNTFVYGTGSSALSGRNSGLNAGYLGRADNPNFGVGITHFQNYSNSTTFKTWISRGDAPSTLTIAYVNLWRNTAAITSMAITALAGQNFEPGSTFSLYGIAAASVGAKATGGTVYSDSQYYYHVFGSTGTFTPLQSLTCDFLVVAGGGGGGSQGGGGGAGGLRAFASQSLSTTNYSVTVGGGGAGATSTSNKGANGNNSTFNTSSASAGGGGGSRFSGSGSNGGSGGGSAFAQAVGTGNAGSYSPVEGYAGGNSTASGTESAGGGGGAGAVGATGSGTVAGAGGIGAQSYNSINFSSWLAACGVGVSDYIAGGGGGSGFGNTVAGAGGTGGGGAGGLAAIGANATANSGSGGGGGGAISGTSYNGGNGGSGIVIVRYAK